MIGIGVISWYCAILQIGNRRLLKKSKENSNGKIQFIYNSAVLPTQKELLNDINYAAKKLFSKLSTLDVNSLDISNYNKQYFGRKLKNLKRHIQLSSYLLSWSLAESKIPYKQFNFLEYGAGSGLTCMLAKELGLNVIYNDIYDVSVKDSKTISKAIGNEAHYYIQGDIEELIDFLNSNNMELNGVASSDVIEQIYDINSFFRKLPSLGKDSLSLVITCTANPFHFYIRRQLMKSQIQHENQDRKMQYGHKQRDTLLAYRKVRLEIIKKYLTESNNTLNNDVISKLVVNTRGMAKNDIHKSLENFLQTGQLPPKPLHPTNTCDPYTGNWCQQLMNPYALADILTANGFNAKVLAGYYGNLDNIIHRNVGKILDKIISYNKNKQNRLWLAPFYTIYATKSQHMK